MTPSTADAPWRKALASLAGPLLLVFLVVVVFGDMLVRPDGRILSTERGDIYMHQIWWRGWGFHELRHGHLPLWNPYIYGGAPYHGGMAAAMLYPPNWIELLVPTNWALNWSFALHLWLAGISTYALCRCKGVSRAASTLAGAMFMFGGLVYLHVYAGHPTVLGAIAWIPLLLLCAERLAETGRWRWGVLAAVAAAMQIYVGHVQFFYYAGMMGGLYVLLLSVAARNSWRSRIRPFVAYVAIYTGAVLLSAAQLLPGIEATKESVRGEGVPIEFAATFSLPPENLLTLVAPHVFGPAWDYVGRCYLWEVCLYLGVTGTLLAGFSLSQRDPRRRSLAILLAVACVLALGYHITPLFKLMYRWWPGYDTFRGTSKFAVFACLVLCVFAGMGLDQLAQRIRASAKPIIAFGVAATLLVAISMAIRVGLDAPDAGVWGSLLSRVAASGESYAPAEQFTDPALIRLSGTRAADHLLLAAGTAAVVAALAWLLRRTRRARYAIVGLGILELFFFARTSVVTLDAMPPLPKPWADVLRDHPGDYRVLLGAAPWVNWGLLYNFQNLYGHDSSSVTRRFAEFLAVSQGIPAAEAGQYYKFTRYPPMLRLLRTRFVLVPDAARPAIELPDPLPRALLVGRYRVIGDRDEAFREIAAPTFDPRAEVLLEHDPSIKPEPGGERGTVNVTTVSSDELHIDADVPVATILLVTDNYSRLWRATPLSPGPQQSYEVVPANRVLRAIPLAAGTHHIRLRYSPRGVPIGFAVTGLTLAGLVAAGVWTRRLHRFASRSA